MDTGAIIKFEKENTDDVRPYVDFDKGWKFTEDDKAFLIDYYENCAKGSIEDFDGDGLEEYMEIFNSLKENGVEKSKSLIQEDAKIMADALIGIFTITTKASPMRCV